MAVHLRAGGVRGRPAAEAARREDPRGDGGGRRLVAPLPGACGARRRQDILHRGGGRLPHRDGPQAVLPHLVDQREAGAADPPRDHGGVHGGAVRDGLPGHRRAAPPSRRPRAAVAAVRGAGHEGAARDGRDGPSRRRGKGRHGVRRVWRVHPCEGPEVGARHEERDAAARPRGAGRPPDARGRGERGARAGRAEAHPGRRDGPRRQGQGVGRLDGDDHRAGRRDGAARRRPRVEDDAQPGGRPLAGRVGEGGPRPVGRVLRALRRGERERPASRAARRVALPLPPEPQGDGRGGGRPQLGLLRPRGRADVRPPAAHGRLPPDGERRLHGRVPDGARSQCVRGGGDGPPHHGPRPPRRPRVFGPGRHGADGRGDGREPRLRPHDGGPRVRREPDGPRRGLQGVPREDRRAAERRGLQRGGGARSTPTRRRSPRSASAPTAGGSTRAGGSSGR